MKHAAVILAIALFATGCAMHPPVQPTNLPVVASSDFDALWDATLKNVEQHFDLFVQRRDQGYMVSTYKQGDPLPGGPLRRDAQTAYDAEEDLLHITRRQLTARISQDAPGVYVLHMEIIRERQGYVPPPAEQQDFGPTYDIYDSKKTALDEAVDQKSTVTWYRLGRDMFLERTLLERIARDVEARGRKVEAPAEPAAPETAPAPEEMTPVTPSEPPVEAPPDKTLVPSTEPTAPDEPPAEAPPETKPETPAEPDAPGPHGIMLPDEPPPPDSPATPLPERPAEPPPEK